MATDIERLVVSLEANIAKYERSLAKALNQTNTSARQIEKRFTDMNKKVGDSFDFGGALTRSAGLLGIGLSGTAAFKAISDAAQQFTKLQNELKVTGLEGAQLEKTFSALFQIAQKNGTAIEPLTTLYSRLSQAQKELNTNSTDMLRFTDGIAQALRVAGTDSTQAAGALLQLSQALGSGTVRAEEFNSVNEGARPILQAVAAGLKEAGGSVSTLKNLVNDGKVSSEAFFRAFLAGMPQLEAQVAKADGTIGQAQARISNAFLALVGHIDQVTGASGNAAKSLNGVADVIDKVGGYFDAANKKLETFQSYLTAIGNNGIWKSIAKFFGADFSPEEMARYGLSPVNQSGPGGRIAEGARDPSGQALAAPKINPVSLKDYAVKSKKDSDADTDAFERATAALQKRIEVLNAETAVVGQGADARAKARATVELETAAKKANADAGLKNTEVTEAQRKKITELAEAYALAAAKAEEANSPLNRLAREASDTNARLNEWAAGSLESVTDSLADVVTGAQSVEDAFKRMAQTIINELARIAIKKAIVGPIAEGLSGLFGGTGATGSFTVGSQTFPKFATGTDFAPGGPAIVGERGPELVNLPRGAQVIPNSVMRRLGGTMVNVGGSTVVVQGDASERTLGLISAALSRYDQQLQPKILDGVRRARETRNL